MEGWSGCPLHLLNKIGESEKVSRSSWLVSFSRQVLNDILVNVGLEISFFTLVLYTNSGNKRLRNFTFPVVLTRFNQVARLIECETASCQREKAVFSLSPLCAGQNRYSAARRRECLALRRANYVWMTATLASRRWLYCWNVSVAMLTVIGSRNRKMVTRPPTRPNMIVTM